MEGCMMLKILVEQKKLLIRDAYTIAELNTFSQAGNSYEAEKGKHDDMVMTLVLFAWLSGQGYIDQLNDGDLMKELREVSDGDFREDLLPFGVIADGLDDEFADIVYMTHDDW
jgi:hypothetical protein